MSLINLTDISMLSNETTAYLYKKLTPPLGVFTPLVMDFGTSLKPSSILSNKFLSNGSYYVYTDTINGLVNKTRTLYKLKHDTSTTKQTYTVAGTIDYNKGTIDINSQVYDRMLDNTLKMFATPNTQDVYSNRNQILVIDTVTGVNINVING